MVEHQEWIGPAYKQGFEGQRIALVGYSHYLANDEADTDSHTVCRVREAVAGDNIRFFDALGSYFGVLDNADLYNRALFFNFCRTVSAHRIGDLPRGHGTRSNGAKSASFACSEHISQKRCSCLRARVGAISCQHERRRLAVPLPF